MNFYGITFEIPGKPHAKQRPQFGGKVAYTPKRTVTAEAIICGEAIKHFKTPFDGPVMVDILAVFSVPVSWAKSKKARMLGAAHTQRPDFDNLQKSVCDALNGVAYADDSQISEARCRKIWGPVAKTVVTVRPLEPVSAGTPARDPASPPSSQDRDPSTGVSTQAGYTPPSELIAAGFPVPKGGAK